MPKDLAENCKTRLMQNQTFKIVLYRERCRWHRCLIAGTYRGFVNLQNNTNGTKIKNKSFEVQLVVQG